MTLEVGMLKFTDCEMNICGNSLGWHPDVARKDRFPFDSHSIRSAVVDNSKFADFPAHCARFSPTPPNYDGRSLTLLS